MAVEAALNPGRNLVYVASPGMGISSPLSTEERTYLRKNGRLLYEDENGISRGLPVITALAQALTEQGIAPTHLYSDSAGALINTAYGAAYGNGNIRVSHQNVRTGYKDMNVPRLAHGMIVTDSRISKEIEQVSIDALRMSERATKLTKGNLGADYKSRGYKPKKSFPI